MVLIRELSQPFTSRSLPSVCELWGEAAVHVRACIQCDMCQVTAFEEDGDYSERGLDGAQTDDADGAKALGYEKKAAA